jgi:predicted transcriptional regulator
MVDDISSNEVQQSKLRVLTAQIVVAYLANHPSALADVPTIIQAAHQAPRGVGQAPTTEVKEARPPAVAIKRSVTPDYLVCLKDGVRMTMLKRHLRTAHGPDARGVSRQMPETIPWPSLYRRLSPGSMGSDCGTKHLALKHYVEH